MDICDKLCRACLSARKSYRYSLFEDVSPETYLFCTSIQVIENENLPKALCDSCYELITKYTDFKRACIQSQYTLTNCWSDWRTAAQEPSDLFEEKTQIHAEKFEFASVKEELSDCCDDDASVPESSNENPVTIQGWSNEKPVQKRQKKLITEHKLKSEVIKNEPYFSFFCELCNRKFRHLERFEAHKLEHEGKTASLHCYPCNKSFSTWSGLKRHRSTAHTRTRVAHTACGMCGRVCASVNARRMHERTHERSHEAKFACVCHICGKRVTTSVILKAHLETHNAGRERKHTCEHCGKKFFTKTILLSHISRQHTGKRYICEICSYPFTDKYNLAKHLLKHEGKKPYKCDICNKEFATNSSSVEHKRIHSGERPFSCSYCPKRFVSKRRLTDHHRIHTGERPHKCNVCDLKFTQRGTLQRHMKIHDKITGLLL